MQKKIIALAVAGLVSGAAFAQSNVTVFGIVDMGYQYSWDNSTSNAKNMSQIKAGGLDGSRFGFRGSEDLGNGLKANFEMAAGFDADTGKSYGGVLMSEGAFVGLSNASWGEVKAGYFGSFLDDNTGIDASGRHGMINTGSLYGTGKYPNFVAYYSPVFSGLQVKAGFSSNAMYNPTTNAVGQDVAPVQNATYDNVRAYTAAVSYTNGPLKAGIAYAAYRPQAVNLSVGSQTTSSSSDWNAGVSYDFGVATVSLFGAQQKINDLNVNFITNPGITTGYDKKTFWALGANAPIGANDLVKVGYGQSKLTGPNNIVNGKGKAWDVVYLHSMSKRTTVYAMYGSVDSNDANGTTNILGLGTDGTYRQALNVGLRHTF